MLVYNDIPTHDDNYCAFLLLACPSLTALTNGMISCLLGSDGDPDPGENCTITCNTGYELNGSGTRTCQNNGSWSGSDATCSTGE